MATRARRPTAGSAPYTGRPNASRGPRRALLWRSRRRDYRASLVPEKGSGRHVRTVYRAAARGRGGNAGPASSNASSAPKSTDTIDRYIQLSSTMTAPMLPYALL
jgi:hypothetical protein